MTIYTVKKGQSAKNQLAEALKMANAHKNNPRLDILVEANFIRAAKEWEVENGLIRAENNLLKGAAGDHAASNKANGYTMEALNERLACVNAGVHHLNCELGRIKRENKDLKSEVERFKRAVETYGLLDKAKDCKIKSLENEFFRLNNLNVKPAKERDNSFHDLVFKSTLDQYVDREGAALDEMAEITKEEYKEGSASSDDGIGYIVERTDNGTYKFGLTWRAGTWVDVMYFFSSLDKAKEMAGVAVRHVMKFMAAGHEVVEINLCYGGLFFFQLESGDVKVEGESFWGGISGQHGMYDLNLSGCTDGLMWSHAVMCESLGGAMEKARSKYSDTRNTRPTS